jgi:hypothetical protein
MPPDGMQTRVGVATLGVGFPYIASMPADFYQSGVIDFV